MPLDQLIENRDGIPPPPIEQRLGSRRQVR
jgi:hypothetical protein